MSLLVCICVVWVYVEFQILVDGPGMYFVGEIICPQASQTCCENTPILLTVNSHRRKDESETSILEKYKNMACNVVFFPAQCCKSPNAMHSLMGGQSTIVRTTVSRLIKNILHFFQYFSFEFEIKSHLCSEMLLNY